jgi:hypothetical protein
VHAEDFVIHDGCHREAVEAVSESLPQLNIIPTLAFVIKAVDAIDTGTLVVASQQEEVLRVLYFVRQQKTNGLEGLLAYHFKILKTSVDVIAKEEVVALRGVATVLEESQQIEILAVHITYI